MQGFPGKFKAKHPYLQEWLAQLMDAAFEKERQIERENRRRSESVENVDDGQPYFVLRLAPPRPRIPSQPTTTMEEQDHGGPSYLRSAIARAYQTDWTSPYAMITSAINLEDVNKASEFPSLLRIVYPYYGFGARHNQLYYCTFKIQSDSQYQSYYPRT